MTWDKINSNQTFNVLTFHLFFSLKSCIRCSPLPALILIIVGLRWLLPIFEASNEIRSFSLSIAFPSLPSSPPFSSRTSSSRLAPVFRVFLHFLSNLSSLYLLLSLSPFSLARFPMPISLVPSLFAFPRSPIPPSSSSITFV